MSSLRAFNAGVVLVFGLLIVKGQGQNGVFNGGLQTGGATANVVDQPTAVAVPVQSTPTFAFPSQSFAPFFFTQPQPTVVPTTAQAVPVEQEQPIVQSQPSQTDQVPVNNVSNNTNVISLNNENKGSNANQNNAASGATALGFEGF